MKYGFVKVASAAPELRVGDPLYNKVGLCHAIDAAYADGVQVLVFPELSLTGATCGDLFFTDKLYADTLSALSELLSHTQGKPMLICIGLPLRVAGRLYDCALALSNGKPIAYTAKSSLSPQGELGQMRHFAAAPDTLPPLSLGDNIVPYAATLACAEMPELQITLSLGEDLTALSQVAPLCLHLTANAEIIGREAYRQTCAKAISANHLCAYAMSNSGTGESTTDMTFAGHCILAAHGTICAEAAPFAEIPYTTTVFDLQHIAHDRRAAQYLAPTSQAAFSLPLTDVSLQNAIEPCPFLPANADPSAVCERILAIQSHGLARRLRAAHAGGAVVALSGGLDSTLALIVAVQAFDLLGWSHEKLRTVTMPCFGTTNRTRSNAEELAHQFGTSFACIDIKAAVDQHFSDIGHDPNSHTVVYENAQARERTQIIMDLANADGSLVIGTGDLSELALGWATYNGDHMSNYGTNGGIPKTLIRSVVSYYADTCTRMGKDTLAAVLRDILATPVSPELLPPKDGDIAQRTEDIVGPYDLHDFFLYHFVRWGEAPDKMRHEAYAAFEGRFSKDTIDGWLRVFLRRFYTQQFKRSALPDGPKVGSVALSPRGAWVMPSDAAGWEE